ncbi:MAG: AAA family ATPase, partial [Acidobacteriota bacterium]|nr:AAA family ATPase [Acidobacteriota bacterium]
MVRRIPLGISDFKELRTENYYFVDKSMLIADIMQSGAKVILLPRPRRFGKTLNMSMLQYFFDDSDPTNADLFNGLAVCGQQDVMTRRGQYPTVFITFKDVKYETFEKCRRAMAKILGKLFLAHDEVIRRAEPRGVDKTSVDQIQAGTADGIDLQDALALLTELIHRGVGKKPIVLVDEYDAPIHAGLRYGYYDRIIGFMRNLLSGGFKDNSHLEKGVLTGILRVAKESIFSGFNNLSVSTILEEEFSNHFGFTEEEVTGVLDDFELSYKKEEVRNWYNGYRFGSHTIYNPWSIMQYTHHARFPNATAGAYWVNTSDNRMIRDLALSDDGILKEDLEMLLRGDPVHKELETNIVLENMTGGAVWSLL